MLKQNKFNYVYVSKFFIFYRGLLKFTTCYINVINYSYTYYPLSLMLYLFFIVASLEASCLLIWIFYNRSCWVYMSMSSRLLNTIHSKLMVYQIYQFLWGTLQIVLTIVKRLQEYWWFSGFSVSPLY